MHLKSLLSLPLLALPLLTLAMGCASERGDGLCQNDHDCLFSGADVGKTCVQGLCEFSTAGGTTAPNFCLPVINPASEFYGVNRCLAQERGQVVLLFFGLIA